MHRQVPEHELVEVGKPGPVAERKGVTGALFDAVANLVPAEEIGSVDTLTNIGLEVEELSNMLDAIKARLRSLFGRN